MVDRATMMRRWSIFSYSEVAERIEHNPDIGMWIERFYHHERFKGCDVNRLVICCMSCRKDFLQAICDENCDRLYEIAYADPEDVAFSFHFYLLIAWYLRRRTSFQMLLFWDKRSLPTDIAMLLANGIETDEDAYSYFIELFAIATLNKKGPALLSQFRTSTHTRSASLVLLLGKLQMAISPQLLNRGGFGLVLVEKAEVCIKLKYKYELRYQLRLMCIALAELDLPALVSVEIFNAAYDPDETAEVLRYYTKSTVVVLVKNAWRKKKNLSE